MFNTSKGLCKHILSYTVLRGDTIWYQSLKSSSSPQNQTVVPLQSDV